MDSPASTLVHPSSKTCSTSQAMTQPTHHSPRHVVAIPNVCCLILGPLGTVSPPSHSRDHHGRSLLLIIGDHSQLDRSPHQWNQLRHSGGFVVDDWWMGRLRNVEVREHLVSEMRTEITFGLYRPNITIFFTLMAVGVSFAWLGVEDPSQWRTGVALYVLGCGSRDFCSHCTHLNSCTRCSSDLVSG